MYIALEPHRSLKPRIHDWAVFEQLKASAEPVILDHPHRVTILHMRRDLVERGRSNSALCYIDCDIITADKF